MEDGSGCSIKYGNRLLRLAIFLLSGSCFGALQKSAEPKALPKSPQSVLVTCWNGKAQWIEAFLSEGGDPNAIDGTGLTLFSRACARGNIEVIQALIAHKDFDPKVSLEFMSEGRTPLMWAAWTGKNDVVKLLIENKVNLETQDELGCTALILAAQEEELGCAQALLQAGAKIGACDNAGFTAHTYAQLKNHHSVIAFLNRYKKNQMDKAELEDLEKQNAPAIKSWCVIQ